MTAKPSAAHFKARALSIQMHRQYVAMVDAALALEHLPQESRAAFESFRAFLATDPRARLSKRAFNWLQGFVPVPCIRCGRPSKYLAGHNGACEEHKAAIKMLEDRFNAFRGLEARHAEASNHRRLFDNRTLGHRSASHSHKFGR